MEGNNTKKVKSLIVAALLLTTIMAPTIAKAKDNQPVYFYLPMYQGTADTLPSLKGSTGGKSVMNLSDIAYGSYAIDGYLKNSAGYQRGDYATGLQQYTRSLIPNWNSAQAGYNYRFRCINHSSVNYDALVTGSWACDEFY